MSKPVTWIFEKYVHEETRQDFIKAIEKYGHNYKVFEKAQDTYDLIDENYDENPFLVYAGIGFVEDFKLTNQINENSNCEPGAIATFKNFKCTEYYTHYTKFLLNYHYVYATVQDLLDNWVFYINLFQSNKIFIRSNSGKKKLTGQCFSIEQKSEFVQQIDIYQTNPKVWLMLAPYKKITREWRFVVCDKKVITGCCYASFDMIDGDPKYNEVQEFAQNVVNSVDFSPDPVYIMDVCSIGDNYYLLELNSFSCSGLYDCDIDVVVNKVSKVAQRIFEDVWGEEE